MNVTCPKCLEQHPVRVPWLAAHPVRTEAATV